MFQTLHITMFVNIHFERNKTQFTMSLIVVLSLLLFIHLRCIGKQKTQINQDLLWELNKRIWPNIIKAIENNHRSRRYPNTCKQSFPKCARISQIFTAMYNSVVGLRNGLSLISTNHTADQIPTSTPSTWGITVSPLLQLRLLGV